MSVEKKVMKRAAQQWADGMQKEEQRLAGSVGTFQAAISAQVK